MQYEVVVGNVGTVLETYREYERQSRRGYGRAAHEAVILIEDGNIVKELLARSYLRG